MNINIKATNTKLTDAIKGAIEDKLSHVQKLIKEDDYVYVELSVDKKHKSGLVNKVEISVNPPKLHAEALGNDFYEALDLVMPKIKEQLTKGKDKKISQRRKAARKLQ